jgi:hypothetical protein
LSRLIEENRETWLVEQSNFNYRVTSGYNIGI